MTGLASKKQRPDMRSFGAQLNPASVGSAHCRGLEQNYAI
jgi:hypothetical protein